MEKKRREAAKVRSRVHAIVGVGVVSCGGHVIEYLWDSLENDFRQ